MSSERNRKVNAMRKPLVIAMLATIVAFMLVQFGPAVVFNKTPAPSDHVRIGIH